MPPSSYVYGFIYLSNVYICLTYAFGKIEKFLAMEMLLRLSYSYENVIASQQNFSISVTKCTNVWVPGHLALTSTISRTHIWQEFLC